MYELSEIEEIANQVNLSSLYEIAKTSARIGNEILKINYNKILKISSKGRKGDLVTNVDLEVENKIKEYLLLSFFLFCILEKLVLKKKQFMTK